MASNAAILDTLLHIVAAMAILAAVGGSPAYNVAVALYGVLGLYSRIPRALLSLLVLVGLTMIADIVQLGVYSKFDFNNSILSYGSVMTILVLLTKVCGQCLTFRHGRQGLSVSPSFFTASDRTFHFQMLQ
jgi:hypothetical protein